MRSGASCSESSRSRPRSGAARADEGDAACSRPELDVLEERIVLDRDLVLDREAAARAAKLAELRHRIDEAGRVADDRIGRLDRQVVADASGLVVVRERTEVRRALRATPAPGAYRDIFGRAQRLLAVELLACGLPNPTDALFASQTFRLFSIIQNHAVDLARCFGRHVAVLDVGLHPGRVAFERVAEAP